MRVIGAGGAAEGDREGAGKCKRGGPTRGPPMPDSFPLNVNETLPTRHSITTHGNSARRPEMQCAVVSNHLVEAGLVLLAPSLGVRTIIWIFFLYFFMFGQ